MPSSAWLGMDDGTMKNKGKKGAAVPPQDLAWDPYYKGPAAKNRPDVTPEKNDHTQPGPSYGDGTPDGGYWGDANHPLPGR